MTHSDFIVPENESIWRSSGVRSSIVNYDHMIAAAFQPLCTHMNITSMMCWCTHWGGDKYWLPHYSEAARKAVMKEGKLVPSYALPEEAKAYLRWLLKGELKDLYLEQ